MSDSLKSAEDAEKYFAAFDADCAKLRETAAALRAMNVEVAELKSLANDLEALDHSDSSSGMVASEMVEARANERISKI